MANPQMQQVVQSQPQIFSLFESSEPESEDEAFVRKRAIVKAVDIQQLPAASGLRQWLSKLEDACLAASNRNKKRTDILFAQSDQGTEA